MLESISLIEQFNNQMTSNTIFSLLKILKNKDHIISNSTKN